MSKTTTSDSEQRENEYERVVEALEPGMIVQFNSSDPTNMTTQEFHIDAPWNGRKLWLRHSGDAEAFLRQDEDGEFILADGVCGMFERTICMVTTIEVVGVAE